MTYQHRATHSHSHQRKQKIIDRQNISIFGVHDRLHAEEIDRHDRENHQRRALLLKDQDSNPMIASGKITAVRKIF